MGMTTRRHYIDNAPTRTLTAGINSVVTTVPISSAAGLPSVPFSATIDLGTASAEQVLVTAIVGLNLTVTRNSNGLGAFTHASAAAFNHTAVAQDYDESNAHLVASAAVHGITGSVVGTSDTQTLSNKTLTSPVSHGASFPTAITGDVEFAGDIFADGVVQANDRVFGFIQTQDFADLAAATAAYGALETSSPQAGDIVFLDAGTNGGRAGLYFFDGSNWRPSGTTSGLVTIASGKVTITPVANTPTSGAVTFPAGRFIAAPNVTLGANTTAPGTVVTGVGVTNITTSGCTVWITRTNTTATDVYWTAVDSA